MRKHKIEIAFAIVAFLLLPSVPIMSAQGTGEEEWGMDITPIVDIPFSDRTVKVLGESEISADLQKGLAFGTGDIHSLDSADEIRSLDDGDILFIDALWLKTAQPGGLVENTRDAILRGVPVVIVGEETELIEKAIDGSQISFLCTSSYKTVGFILYPLSGVTASICLMGGAQEIREKWIVEGVARAYDWCVMKMDMRDSEDMNGGEMVLLDGPYWAMRTEMLSESQDTFAPYGRINNVIRVYKLMNDANAYFDWFNIENEFETVPGWVAYSNTWRNMDQDNYQDIDLRSGHQSDELVDYDPTSTPGSSSTWVTIGVQAGVQGASVTCSMSWSYSTSDVPVTCRCDMSSEMANWWHNINEGDAYTFPPVAVGSYKCEPGWTVRTNNGGHAQIDEHFHVRWCRTHWIIYPIWSDWETMDGYVSIGCDNIY